MKRINAFRSDKDALIGEVHDIWEESGLTLAAFADAANIATQTLYNWFYGDTLTPHLRSIRKICRAFDYDIVTVRGKGHNIKRGR